MMMTLLFCVVQGSTHITTTTCCCSCCCYRFMVDGSLFLMVLCISCSFFSFSIVDIALSLLLPSVVVVVVG